MKNVSQIIQKSPDVGSVVFKGMVSKTTEGNHFPVGIQIFVHDKNLL